LKRLKEEGHKIVIYSVRSNLGETNKKNGHYEMVEYLKKHGVEYDDIHTHKPHFNLVIDDKGCGVSLDRHRNVDWVDVLKAIKDKEYI